MILPLYDKAQSFVDDGLSHDVLDKMDTVILSYVFSEFGSKDISLVCFIYHCLVAYRLLYSEDFEV